MCASRNVLLVACNVSFLVFFLSIELFNFRFVLHASRPRVLWLCYALRALCILMESASACVDDYDYIHYTPHGHGHGHNHDTTHDRIHKR